MIGEAVALAGDSILAGIPGSPDTNGAARVYSTGDKLEVTGVKGTVKDQSKAGKDSFALEGTLTVLLDVEGQPLEVALRDPVIENEAR